MLSLQDAEWAPSYVAFRAEVLALSLMLIAESAGGQILHVGELACEVQWAVV